MKKEIKPKKKKYKENLSKLIKKVTRKINKTKHYT